MITGAHFLLYSKNADADRRFLSDVLGWSGVDAGRGWMILALPPAEIAVHPSDENFVQEEDNGIFGAVLYLMCDDLEDAITSLESKGVDVGKTGTAPWGTFTQITLPSGGKLGLYQPKHAVAIASGR
jgi:predicted enzyme related to lactoylglutathione lyase